MSREQIAGWIIAIAGLTLLALSVFSDQLGVGDQAGTLSYQQIMGVIAGVVILIIGAAFISRKPPEV